MGVAEEAWALALGALPIDDGLRMLEAAEVRCFQGTGPNRFQKLCSIGDLDAFLASDAARTPRVGLADSRQGSAMISEDDYTTGDEGQIDPARLLALHDAGATLVLSQMHEVLGSLGRFCRGLERIFLHPVQCNIYLTPPGAQGFRTHYDTHDVLILQVQGEKSWRTWPTPWVQFANEHTPLRGEPKPTEAPQSHMLRAGDVLYVPRGVLHDAASQGAQSSLHLTIGLLSRSWGGALRAALDLMERDDPSLRQTFPTWRLAEGGVSDDLVAQAGKRASALGTVSVMELTAQLLLTKLATEQKPMLGRGLLAPTVTPTDRLTLCETVHYVVVPHQDGSAELRWTGGTMVLSAQEFDWLGALAEGASASTLGGAEALAFCQMLAAAGLVTIEPAPVRGAGTPQA